MQHQVYKVRDKRSRGWFWVDNDFFDSYTKIVGPVGTAIYMSLCRHADNITQQCFPAMELIAKENNISRNTVSKYIKLFVKYRLITIERERDERTKKWINNTYTMLDKTEWILHAQPLGTGSHAQLTSEPCTTDDKSHAQPLGNKETHSEGDSVKETHTPLTPQGGIGNLTNELIALFEAVNPNYQSLFPRKVEREAIEWLVAQRGSEWVKNVITVLPKIISQPFAPRITTPSQLRSKLGDLKVFYDQQKNKATSKGKEIIGLNRIVT